MNEEDEIIQLYTRRLRDELKHPEVQAAKQKLMVTFFKPEPVVFFGAELFAPALAVFMLFFVFQFLQVPNASKVANQEPPLKSEVIIPVPEVPAAPAIVNKESVVVESVSSNVGSTMVFQKKYDNVPVTIVWVFMGGSH